MTEACWKKGKRIVTGKYEWDSYRGAFRIELNSRDPVTGEARRFWTNGESPEFNGFRLIESAKLSKSWSRLFPGREKLRRM